MTEDTFKTSPNTPAHLFQAGAVYMLTGAAYERLPHIGSDARKAAWLESFKFAATHHGWAMKAWVVLHNHYHVLVQAPETSAESLPKLIASFHKFTARRWNAEDGQAGRQVWWNYWDTCLRSEAAYLARWNYVHWNPVRHHLVSRPEDYAFSSYGVYYDAHPDAVRRTEQEYPYTGVDDVPDDF